MARRMVVSVFGIGLASTIYQNHIRAPLKDAGVFPNRVVDDLNNERCKLLDGLQGCEDMWLHRESGLAYLPCTPPEDRAHWLPATDHLDRMSASFPAKDSINVLDTKTEKHFQIDLKNLPPHIVQNGLHLHGIDLFVNADGKTATIFVNNHNPPANPQDGHKVGADSVIELFETTLGSTEATYVGTVRHPSVFTPNSLVAVGPRSFYVSNDHAEKVHWNRAASIWLGVPGSGITYCSVDNGFASPNCFAASPNYLAPNGIAKGPGNKLYMATTWNAHLRSFEIQPNHTLVEVGKVKIPRPIDNIHVSPSGTVYLATIPKGFAFLKGVKNIHKDKTNLSPTEVWRVKNGTVSLENPSGWEVDKVFGDQGTQVGYTTNALPFNNKLYMTGIISFGVSICDVDPEFTV